MPDSQFRTSQRSPFASGATPWYFLLGVYLVIAFGAVGGQAIWKLYAAPAVMADTVRVVGVEIAPVLAGGTTAEQKLLSQNVADALTSVPYIAGVRVYRKEGVSVFSGIVDVADPFWKTKGMLASLRAVEVPFPEGQLVLYYNAYGMASEIFAMAAWQVICFLLGALLLIVLFTWQKRRLLPLSVQSKGEAEAESSGMPNKGRLEDAVVYADNAALGGRGQEVPYAALDEGLVAETVTQEDLSVMLQPRTGQRGAWEKEKAGLASGSKPVDNTILVPGPDTTIPPADAPDLLEHISDNFEGGAAFRIVFDSRAGRRVTYLGKGFTELFGIPVRTVLEDANTLYRLIVPDDLAMLSQKERECLQSRGSYTAEVRMKSLLFDERWIQFRARAGMTSAGEACLDGLLLDMTIQRHVEDQLKEIATTDALTGLANRRHFMQLGEAEIERTKRYGSPVSLIMMDADHFKKVNDTYGHDAGDDVLVALARTMRQAARGVDTAARLGGEEFIILLPETTIEKALCMAERVRAAVTELRIESGGHVLHITASFGVASVPLSEAAETVNLHGLMRMADEALYAAKRNGRNRVVPWEPSFSETV